MGVKQDVVGEQGKFFIPAKVGQHITGRGVHDIIMDFVHKWTYRFEVHNDKYFSKTRSGRCLRPWIKLLTALLWVAAVPHGIVS